MLDIPSETGLIISSLNRVDSIDALYEPDDPRPFLDEVQRLTGATIDWYLILDERSLSSLVDLLDGISVFLPDRISDVVNEVPVSLPSGFVVLDGRKTLAYASYSQEDAMDSELVAKRQSRNNFV